MGIIKNVRHSDDERGKKYQTTILVFQSNIYNRAKEMHLTFLR